MRSTTDIGGVIVGRASSLGWPDAAVIIAGMLIGGCIVLAVLTSRRPPR